MVFVRTRRPTYTGDTGAGHLAREHEKPEAAIEDRLPQIREALADLERRDVVQRIWRGDHTVWKADPTEITNRLGWLTVSDSIRDQSPAIVEFAAEVKDLGFRHVVLLGMGGSSLGPEVLRQTFGSADGYPELNVLDSTVPEWVGRVAEAIDPARTLFLVSSKSGGTIEPNVLYRYFRGVVERSVAGEHAGKNFVAVTDEGTPLEDLGHDEGFRAVFLNPPDIGGRYSVLSYFGLVPAGLMGLDPASLLDSANAMREACAASVPGRDNPGAVLGATMAALALEGRDKLTLVTSPSIASFGLWAEQLIAESLGKEGKGIVPVAGEPVVDPEFYGADRLFVYLRLEGDDNRDADSTIAGLKSAGHPVVLLDLGDPGELGAEFFRWELATAIAGAIIGVHPFDQPDVQAAKDMTDGVLRGYRAEGTLAAGDATTPVETLLSRSQPGDYLAVMAYLPQTAELDRAFDVLRRRVVERHGTATTLGYGPRFLHSTGQLHKGGPPSGIFLQITTDHVRDLEIPGEAYSFGVLADAQASGDLQALQAAVRRVAHVKLDAPSAQGVIELADALLG